MRKNQSYQKKLPPTIVIVTTSAKNDADNKEEL